jgi:hypothetical protein
MSCIVIYLLVKQYAFWIVSDVHQRNKGVDLVETRTRLQVSDNAFKGIVSKLMIKFWMCQKCGKMKD